MQPHPNQKIEGTSVHVEGWAWHHDPIEDVQLSIDGAHSWQPAQVEDRVDFGWQRFNCVLQLGIGVHEVVAMARSRDGSTQPLKGRRNHCHAVSFEVIGS